MPKELNEKPDNCIQLQVLHMSTCWSLILQILILKELRENHEVYVESYRWVRAVITTTTG